MKRTSYNIAPRGYPMSVMYWPGLRRWSVLFVWPSGRRTTRFFNGRRGAFKWARRVSIFPAFALARAPGCDAISQEAENILGLLPDVFTLGLGTLTGASTAPTSPLKPTAAGE